MKKTYSIGALLPLVLLFAVFLISSSFDRKSKKEDLKYAWVQDSIKVLNSAGGFVAGLDKEASPLEKRYYAIIESLYRLPLSEMRKMLDDKNLMTQAYGFLLVTKKYPDSLRETDLAVFEDKTPFYIYSNKGPRDIGISFGQMTKMFYEGGQEERRKTDMEIDVRKAVYSFVKAYAKYPSSYRSKCWANYSYTSAGEDGETYETEHNYEIRDRDSNLMYISHFFVLDGKLKMNMIEKERSNSISTHPPALRGWLEQYGRDLTSQDSSNLALGPANDLMDEKLEELIELLQKQKEKD